MGCNMINFRLFLVLLFGCAVSLPASAKLYKWVDNQGVTHYGETIPPEYANKDRSELNKSGQVIKKSDVLTPEELRAKKQADAEKRVEDAATVNQKRHDKALLNTYSNVEEIELSKQRNLQQVNGRINGINTQIKIVQGNLQGYQREAEAFTKAGRKIPANLQDDLKESQARLDKLQQGLEKSNAEKASVEARFEADKVRYRELTGAP